MSTHINSISCGQGAPSLYLIVMAGEKLFPCDLAVVADTGWETDCLWSTGQRTTAKDFFECVTKPLANSYGIDAVMVRAQDRLGNKLQSIPFYQKLGDKVEIDIPLHGSRGGKLKQSCTSKWKIAAIRQELRRRGATTATTALGIHSGESHRLKDNDVQWQRRSWPLLDVMDSDSGDGLKDMGIGKRLSREMVVNEMIARGIPYLITTECDGCPHKDFSRWDRTSSDTINELESFEASFAGEFFLTKHRVPLRQAILLMEEEERGKRGGLFDICDEGYCFV